MNSLVLISFESAWQVQLNGACWRSRDPTERQTEGEMDRNSDTSAQEEMEIWKDLQDADLVDPQMKLLPSSLVCGKITFVNPAATLENLGWASERWVHACVPTFPKLFSKLGLAPNPNPQNVGTVGYLYILF